MLLNELDSIAQHFGIYLALDSIFYVCAENEYTYFKNILLFLVSSKSVLIICNKQQYLLIIIITESLIILICKTILGCFEEDLKDCRRG